MTTLVTANMRIRDMIARYPATMQVMHRYGFRCEDCHSSRYESVGQGAAVHALDLPALLSDLNRAAAGLPASGSSGSTPSPTPLIPLHPLPHATQGNTLPISRT